MIRRILPWVYFAGTLAAIYLYGASIFEFPRLSEIPTVAGLAILGILSLAELFVWWKLQDGAEPRDSRFLDRVFKFQRRVRSWAHDEPPRTR